MTNFIYYMGNIFFECFLKSVAKFDGYFILFFYNFVLIIFYSITWVSFLEDILLVVGSIAR